jgi:RNase P/RNase MRP subunit p29
MRWAVYVAYMGRVQVRSGLLWGKLEGRSLLGRPRRRLKDNIKMDPQEVG